METDEKGGKLSQKPVALLQRCSLAVLGLLSPEALCLHSSPCWVYRAFHSWLCAGSTRSAHITL